MAAGADWRHRALHDVRGGHLCRNGGKGYNRAELGKIILAACFINDIGTVLALGLIFANYNIYLVLFAVITIAVVAFFLGSCHWQTGKRA